jgi:antitoxin HigA-1
MRTKSIPPGRYGGPPIHPGEILHEDFMRPAGLTAYALAKALRVPQTRLGQVLAGKRAITADTALRLARCLGTTPGFWLGLQAAHDLRAAELDHGAAIDEEVAALEAVPT